MRRLKLPAFLFLFLGVSTFWGAIPSLAGDSPIRPSESWPWDVDGIERLLPQWETPEERASGLRSEPPLRNDPPPLAPIRNVGEYEPMTGALIRYPLGIPYAIINEMAEEVTIHVIVSDSNYNSAVASFQANGVPMEKVDWIVAPNNSIWTRDYGPWFVFDGNGGIAIIDHYYNRPARPDDNNIPIVCGQHWGIPVHTHDLWHTGGNYMTDGYGISFSTDLVWDENAGMTHQQIFEFMQSYYGLNAYNVVPDISQTGIHHIDCWAKLLDEETVIVKQVAVGHPDYPELEQNATLIASLPSSTGRNYRVVRVYCQSIPNGGVASYTNCLILNDKVLVPTFNQAPYDADALQAYRDAMPGYEVLGFYYGQWLTDDALHCRVLGVADRNMLRVEHTPIVEWSTYSPIEIRAFVDDRSETGLLPGTPIAYWRAYPDGSLPPHFAADVMAPAGDADTYAAFVPAQASGTRVDYYIHAADNSGREEGMPRPEPSAWYSFVVTLPAADAAEGPRDGGASLASAAPNPFHTATTFTFELKFADRVRLAVYDAQGRLVRTLVNDQVSGGKHAYEWNGRNDAGERLAAGAYFYRLQTSTLTYTRKAVLTK